MSSCVTSVAFVADNDGFKRDPDSDHVLIRVVVQARRQLQCGDPLVVHVLADVVLPRLFNRLPTPAFECQVSSAVVVASGCGVLALRLL